MIKRVFLIVLDGCGIGELPDADLYGDRGSNTLKNLSHACGGLHLPVMGKLGLGCLGNLKGVPPHPSPEGIYGKLAEKSKGKDSTVGHWELTGIISESGFPVYPEGFPPEILSVIEEKTGKKFLYNKPASGTEIINRLGAEHIRTGKPILYTSADSVFQVAAHEDIIPLEELYRICFTARELLLPPHNVLRVIARPFTGADGNFRRTKSRKDFSLVPPSSTILDYIKESGKEVWGVGKIDDLFAMQGITKTFHTTNNNDTIDKIKELQKIDFNGLLFANLIDFDMAYGHRNDVKGYAQALEYFDFHLKDIINGLNDDDLLIITSDHGNDPTTPSTDHSREYTPLLGYSKILKEGVNIGTRDSFSDCGKTITDALGVRADVSGTSFWDICV